MDRKKRIAECVKACYVDQPSASRFPLAASMLDHEDITAMVEVIMSGRITYGPLVKKFEQEYAAILGAPYSVMENSGSSANLLAFAAAVNPGRAQRLHKGDHVVVPAVCWSTSVAPIRKWDVPVT